MATQAAQSRPAPDVVGNSFVEQYYIVLAEKPELVHRFYKDGSVIGRPGSDGSMVSFSTLDEIKKICLSKDYENRVVQVLTADSQESVGQGVIVLVTGIFGTATVRRKFTQLFFLVEEEHGIYFVLNDVFRHVGEELVTVEASNVDDTVPTAPVTLEPEESIVSDRSLPDQATSKIEDVNAQANDTQDNDSTPVLEDEKILTAEREDLPDHAVDRTPNDIDAVSVGTSQNNVHSAPKEAASNVPETLPEKTYASVAMALNFKTQPFQQRPPPPKPAKSVEPAKPVEQSPAAVAPKAPASPVKNNAMEKHISRPVASNGCSIFVGNLPMDVSVEELAQAFERFGTIKPHGVQVRSYKQERVCFGFVEFESASSAQEAVKVAFVRIGNREAHIEAKNSNRDGGRFPPRRGGPREDNFRSRGNFNGGGGRGAGRNEFENKGGSSGPARGTSGRNGEGNQKVYQNGGGRAPRQGQAKPEAEAEAQGVKK